MAMLYGLMSIAVLAQMAAAYLQFLGAYYSLHEFDTPAVDFIFISLCLLLPFWAVGALMLRACIQRLRLAWWVHRSLKTVAYSTPLRPAEAGFLADYEYTHRELAATLLDLHFRGVIKLTVGESGGITIIQIRNLDTNASPYEQSLLTALSNSATQSFAAFTDPRLIALAAPAHEVLINDLVARSMVQRERLPRPGMRRCFRVVSFIAGSVGVISANGFIFHRAETLSINYPRYPVNFAEPTVLVIAAFVVVGIIVSSYWPRFAQGFRDPRYKAWVDAAGFMLYLRTVFTDRFSAKNIGTQDRNTLRTYTPYAVAYGIIPDSTERIRQILAQG